jgi:hypothetical protein
MHHFTSSFLSRKKLLIRSKARCKGLIALKFVGYLEGEVAHKRRVIGGNRNFKGLV